MNTIAPELTPRALNTLVDEAMVAIELHRAYDDDRDEAGGVAWSHNSYTVRIKAEPDPMFSQNAYCGRPGIVGVVYTVALTIIVQAVGDPQDDFDLAWRWEDLAFKALYRVLGPASPEAADWTFEWQGSEDAAKEPGNDWLKQPLKFTVRALRRQL